VQQALDRHGWATYPFLSWLLLQDVEMPATSAGMTRRATQDHEVPPLDLEKIDILLDALGIIVQWITLLDRHCLDPYQGR